MATTFEQIHPQVAQGILETLDEHDGKMPRQLYRVVYVSKIHPNERDVTEVALVKVTLHAFASDADDFAEGFKRSVPELYPVLFTVSYAPVSPDVPEDGMLTIEPWGPRELVK